ncbi:MAG: [protein-PII] uridylyltransferase [Burkholderiales bacterium]
MPDAAAPLAIPGEALAAWRAQLRDGREALKHGFLARPDTTRLLRGHARLVDAVIREVWVAAGCPARAALVAVGGYGRGQLYPHSDVDLLILLPESGESDGAPIERFLAALWDVGIEVGHSARSVRQCLSEMAADATIRTSLLEHRHLAGDRALYREYSKAYAAAMDARDFYDAKTLEQQQRHLKYHDAAYNLEPNLKESPGGLRDLQTVVWIARAAGLGRSWSELARAGLMTAVEARSIARQERLIGALRARLHYLAGRREDRLVFDLQTALAREIGLADTPTRRASELLMQRYYRAAKTVRQVNTILLQNLHARLFPIPRDPVPISDDYCAIDELLHVASEDLYDRKPSAMLDAFLLMERHPELKGMSARTLRALWRWRHRIDARFRRDHGNRERFVALFREPRGITHELRRMNLYGILGAYLPAFGRIVGQMQHDLFHVYTVDEHILMVIRNLRRFTEPQHAHEYPLCSRLIADLPRKDVLYLAGLFHDIAKGRGGDHSALGARDARRFCREHGLPPADADDVAWLVEHHLTMSATAQKQDLSDPEVVAAFAAKVGREERLVLLYLLTVADIRGTSPRVWNAWKAQLLEDLFHATRRVLGGGDAKRTLGDSLQARQAEAQRLLRLRAVPDGAEQALWRHLDTPYFQRHTADEIAWHARNLWWRVERVAPVVKARIARTGTGLQVLVYVPDQKALFARICGTIGRAGLTIMDAKVHTTRHGWALDTFAVQDPNAPDEALRETCQRLEHDLVETLASEAPIPAATAGRVPRQLKHFPLTPEVSLYPDDKGTHYILEIVAGDRPGLLARIATVLANANVNVASAKINTLGDRAEDVFLIDGARLHDEQALLRLEHALYDQLRV